MTADKALVERLMEEDMAELKAKGGKIPIKTKPELR
jgi:hypothetical protein